MKMRIFISMIVLFFTFQFHVAAADLFMFTSFHEPAKDGLRFLYSKDGLHWDSIPGIWLKPEVGKERVMRDPSIVQGPHGIFHLVWTSSWKNDLGFGYSSSKDLIHWTKERLIPVMKDNPETINVWAPDIFYDDIYQQYVIVWASCIPHRFKKGLESENNNHRLYYVTTKNFNKFSKTKLLYDPGFSSIDATIVKRGNHDYVMVFKDNTRPNRDLKVAFAKTPIGPYSKASKSFTESFTEGPTVEKLGQNYVIYFDAYRKKSYGASVTRDFVHFKDISNNISIPKGHKHGTIFKAPTSIVENLIKTHQVSLIQETDSTSKILSSLK